MLSSVMTSARKCECLTFHLSVLVRSDAILVVTAHQSAYMAEILTHSITNSISCQNLTTKTKTLPNSLANLWIVIQLLSRQIPLHVPHFCTFCRQAGTLNIQHPWQMSFHFWTLQNNQILVCCNASSLKANVNIWEVSAPILPICNNNLIKIHCSLKSVIFWRNKNCTGHNTQHFTATHATTLKSTTNDNAGSTPLPHRWWVLYKLQ